MPGERAKNRPTKKSLYGRQAVIASCLLLALIAISVGKIYWLGSRKQDKLAASPIPSWRLSKVGSNHQIEGYSSLASAVPGATINLHVSCRAQSFTTDIFRMGWYGGRGAKYLIDLGNHRCPNEAIPDPDTSTGLVNLNWPSTLQLHIGSDWQPGIYLAKLTNNDGFQNYIPFTVRTIQPKSRFLFIHSINTDLAYNLWGGNSLYLGHTPALKLKRAVEASLNRPFLMPGGGDDGSGDFLKWEYPMILFLEENNYQVDYATDVDVHEHPDILLKYKAVIITGHDEYWSRQMLEGYRLALAQGVNLAVFAANTAYRPVRFEPDPFTGVTDRIMVNYKSADLDPFTKTNPNYSTPAGWQSPPLNEPPSELLGDSYGGEVKNGAVNTLSASLVVSDDSSWIFNGTGLKKGDKIPGLVGYEYDAFNNGSPHPSPIDIIFHSPLTSINGRTDYADSTYYELPGGGQVFDAGTMEWSWGLSPSQPTYSSKLVKVTENILNRFGDS